MATYQPVTSISPVGFDDSAHHWVFKYWKGDSVEQARKIVREVFALGFKDTKVPGGRIRSSYGTCTQNRKNPFDIFCLCCQVAGTLITLQYTVGNMLIPLCDEDAYSDCGLSHLVHYDHVMPPCYSEPELDNISEILSNKYTWQSLVNRIYSRRHWLAVIAYCTELIDKWIRFFSDIAEHKKGKTPFTDVERERWTKDLFKPPTYERNEFVFNKTDILFFQPGILEDFAARDFARRSIEELKAILSHTGNFQVYYPWSFVARHKSNIANFVDTIVGSRETMRRKMNLQRVCFEPQLIWIRDEMDIEVKEESSDEEGELLDFQPKRSPPLSKLPLQSPPRSPIAQPLYIDDTQFFKFPDRERMIMEQLMENMFYEFDTFWPYIPNYDGDYHKCILLCDCSILMGFMERLIIDIGKVFYGKIRVRQFSPETREEGIDLNLDRVSYFTAVLVKVSSEQGALPRAYHALQSAIEKYFSSNSLEYIEHDLLNQECFLLIEIGGILAWTDQARFIILDSKTSQLSWKINPFQN